MKEIDIQYVRKFRELLRRFEQEIYFLNSGACCNGVSLAQCITLLEIEKHGTLSVTKLAHNLALDKSTVSRTVDGLFNIGLVSRTVSPESRRVTSLCLTPQGLQTCEKINKVSDGYLIQTLGVLDDKEQEQWLIMFGKITERMISLRDVSSKGCC